MTDRERFSESRDSRALERLKGTKHPPADPSFREALKRDFVSGEFRSRPVLVPMPPRPRRNLLVWVAGAAAVAALVIVVTAINQPPSWTVLPGTGTGNLVVNGVSIPVRQTNELTRRIRPGSRLRLVCDQELDLVSSGAMALQLTPGTELVLPSPPGRWFARSSRASVTAGHVRVTTGRRFQGARLAITTPEATVRVTGTTLAVITGPTGTCVCVLEGSAAVRPHRGETTRINAGLRCEVPSGAHRSATGDMRGTERPKLLDLRDRMRAVMN